jgi:pantoate--beta-alanine ligase
MKVMTKPAKMQKASSVWSQRGQSIAFVPTMGALHEAHAALIRQAAKMADRVVVSAYVNPTQFNSKADFVAYPKRRAADMKIAAQAGADVLFRPHDLYAKDASTWVEESDRSRGRCGAKRSGHFRGVATVVVKLLSIVQPKWIILGEKDGQQCEVLQRVVRDLFLPVKVVRCRTVREGDGLPMSSRNRRLSDAQRERAGRWARAVREAARGGPRGAVGRLKRAVRGITGVRLEYAEAIRGVLWAAAWIGNVRLIDHQKCGGS